MFNIEYTGRFRSDLKILKKRSPQNFEILRNFILAMQQTGIDGIEVKHKPHKLKGKYSKHNECHVLPDLLLIWMENKTSMKITLVRTGTHSDLF